MRKLFFILIALISFIPVSADTIIDSEDWKGSTTITKDLVLHLPNFTSYEFGFTRSSSISENVAAVPSIVFTPVVDASGNLIIEDQEVNAYWNVTGVDQFSLNLKINGPLKNGDKEIGFSISWGNNQRLLSSDANGRTIMTRNLTRNPLHESGFIPLTLSIAESSINMSEISYSGSYTSTIELCVQVD